MSDPVLEDVILRMQEDLKRALARPRGPRRWVMVIDQRRCIGCHACTVSCIAENKLPPGVVYRPVLEEETGSYPRVGRRSLPRPCMQCDEPPCTGVCPVGATRKQAEGVVTIDYQQCIGCRSCIAACPYGARTFDAGEDYTQGTVGEAAALAGQARAGAMERSPMFEYGQAVARRKDASPIGKVRKCHFCLHRLAEGFLPSCVSSCVGRATAFGDESDPESLVARLAALPNAVRLKEDLGTAPRVRYLV